MAANIPKPNMLHKVFKQSIKPNTSTTDKEIIVSPNTSNQSLKISNEAKWFIREKCHDKVLHKWTLLPNSEDIEFSFREENAYFYINFELTQMADFDRMQVYNCDTNRYTHDLKRCGSSAYKSLKRSPSRTTSPRVFRRPRS